MTKEHLIHLLELGNSVEYTNQYENNHNKTYCYIFSIIIDEENLLANNGTMFSMSDIDFTNGTFKIVTPAPKLLPVGTKVVVLENCPDYEDYKDTPMEITGHFTNGSNYDFQCSGISLPIWAVAPIEVTEPHKYQEVIDLIEDSNYCFVLNNAKEVLLERIKNLK